MDFLTPLNRGQEKAGVKTVIVLGCARGGTSAMAGFLRELGVAFPDIAHPLKHEWSPVHYDMGKVDRVRTRQALDIMNALGVTWGWKSPRDVFSFHNWISLVQNPYFVIVLRNPLDIMASSARWDRVALPVSAAPLGRTIGELCRFITFTPLPIMLVSYEKLCASGGLCARDIAAWLGLETTELHLRNAAQFVSGINEGYRGLVSSQVAGLVATRDAEADTARVQLAMYPPVNDDLRRMTEALAEDIAAANRIMDCMSAQLSALTARCLMDRLNITQPTPAERLDLLQEICAGRTQSLHLRPPTPDSYDDHDMAAREAARASAEAAYHEQWAMFSAMSRRRLLLQREMDDLAHQCAWLERVLAQPQPPHPSAGAAPTPVTPTRVQVKPRHKPHCAAAATQA